MPGLGLGSWAFAQASCVSNGGVVSCHVIRCAAICSIDRQCKEGHCTIEKYHHDHQIGRMGILCLYANMRV